MKQFNLKEYFANPSRKLVTRDGRNARIICTNVKTTYPIVAVVEKDKDEEFVLSFLKDGRLIRDTISMEDLFFAPEKHEGWVNVFKEDKFYNVGNLFSSKEDALAVTKGYNVYVATIKIEWEE